MERLNCLNLFKSTENKDFQILPKFLKRRILIKILSTEFLSTSHLSFMSAIQAIHTMFRALSFYGIRIIRCLWFSTYFMCPLISLSMTLLPYLADKLLFLASHRSINYVFLILSSFSSI